MQGEVGALGVNRPEPQGVWREEAPASALPPELRPQHLCGLLQLLSHVLQPLHILLLAGSEMG